MSMVADHVKGCALWTRTSYRPSTCLDDTVVDQIEGTIDQPFSSAICPQFACEIPWTLAQLLDWGYIKTSPTRYNCVYPRGGGNLFLMETEAVFPSQSDLRPHGQVNADKKLGAIGEIMEQALRLRTLLRELMYEPRRYIRYGRGAATRSDTMYDAVEFLPRFPEGMMDGIMDIIVHLGLGLKPETKNLSLPVASLSTGSVFTFFDVSSQIIVRLRLCARTTYTPCFRQPSYFGPVWPFDQITPVTL
ncbi:uncharacterized protein BT62DRAFT_921659 [Guyanagaster necrorhizus]|uniref:Uncharacterized protein n=1 Tax=Guyanagaster necrorhizus TaxID=856835 RepID=A0A9P7VM22_9AGAR|nr:uncharacterized protein BT62DRAFT_921659 [Guyanagaster necrorhizus MCA 3950]KAG7443701.1 hypothetical protein BT62DRAFT_921659 [Guyanagaster necrorhizus MCA 3950]